MRAKCDKQKASYVLWYAAILRNAISFFRYWKLNNAPLVIVARRTAMEGMKRKRENKQREEIFLASPSQSQMARDSGLFFFCVCARHKDGRTILFVVINWLLVGDQVHSALTWRRVLTQRRRKGKKKKTSHLLSSVSSGRENNRPDPSEALTPENKHRL